MKPYRQVPSAPSYGQENRELLDAIIREDGGERRDAPLDTVFAQFSKACEHLMKSDPAMLMRIKKAPLFSFEKEAYDRSLEIARGMNFDERFMPPGMPFDDVLLLDNKGVTFLFDVTDYEYGERPIPENEIHYGTAVVRPTCFLRRFKAIVFLFSAMAGSGGESNKYWSFMEAFVQQTDPAQGEMKRGFVVDKFPWAVGATDAGADMKVDMGWSSDAEIGKGMVFDFVNSVDTAMDELHYIDLPRHYLVEERPAKMRDPEKSPKIPRRHERPRMILLDPEEIHHVYKSAGGDGKHASPIPHSRRGHTKILKSERYKLKRWQRIHIRPTWVGKESWEHNKLHYRVIHRKNDQ